MKARQSVIAVGGLSPWAPGAPSKTLSVEPRRSNNARWPLKGKSWSLIWAWNIAGAVNLVPLPGRLAL